MKKDISIKIYELPACCSTSLVNPGNYSALQKLEADAQLLQSNGVSFQRIDVTRNPQVLSQEPALNDFLKDKESSVFPVTIINGAVMKDSSLPTESEFTEWTGIALTTVTETAPRSCCG